MDSYYTDANDTILGEPSKVESGIVKQFLSSLRFCRC